MNKMVVVNSYDELMKIGLIDRTPEYDYAAEWEKGSQENKFPQSKYVVIYTKTGLPSQIVWLVEDDEQVWGEYVVVYRRPIRKSWLKELRKTAATALRCAQKAIVFVDIFKDDEDEE